MSRINILQSVATADWTTEVPDSVVEDGQPWRDEGLLRVGPKLPLHGTSIGSQSYSILGPNAAPNGDGCALISSVTGSRLGWTVRPPLITPFAAANAAGDYFAADGTWKSIAGIGPSAIFSALGFTPINKAGDTNIGSLTLATGAHLSTWERITSNNGFCSPASGPGFWADSSGVALSSSAYVGWSSGDAGNTGGIDSKVLRSGTGQIDTRSNSGLRVRNYANSGYAGLYAGEIQSSSIIQGQGYYNAASGEILWYGRTGMSSPADGHLKVENSSHNAGVLFDVTTDATLKLRNRTNNADAVIAAASLKLSNNAQILPYSGGVLIQQSDATQRIFLNSRGAILENTAGLEWSTGSAWLDTPDAKIVRSTTGQLDVRAVNGLRIRNLVDSGFANLQADNIQAITQIRTNTTGFFEWNSRTKIFSDANATMRLTDDGQTVGVTLDFATDGTLKARNRTNSADADITARQIMSYGGAGVGLRGNYNASTGSSQNAVRIEGGIIFQAGGTLGLLGTAAIPWGGITQQGDYINFNTGFSGTTNYERGYMRWVANEFQIGNECAGTGNLRYNKYVGNAHIFMIGGSPAWYMEANSLAPANTVTSIGSTSLPVEHIYIGRNVVHRGDLRNYNTGSYDGSTNYERGYQRWTSNVYQIGSEAGGTGVVRDVDIKRGSGTSLNVGNGVVNVLDGAGGHSALRANAFYFSWFDSSLQLASNVSGNRAVQVYTDNGLAATFGGSGVSRSATFAWNITAGNDVTAPSQVAAGYGFMFGSGVTGSRMRQSADGVLRFTNNGQDDFGRLQLGGTTSAYPSIKRAGAGVAIRTADDSADAALSAGAVTATGGTLVPAYTSDVSTVNDWAAHTYKSSGTKVADLATWGNKLLWVSDVAGNNRAGLLLELSTSDSVPAQLYGARQKNSGVVQPITFGNTGAVTTIAGSSLTFTGNASFSGDVYLSAGKRIIFPDINTSVGVANGSQQLDLLGGNAGIRINRYAIGDILFDRACTFASTIAAGDATFTGAVELTGSGAARQLSVYGDYQSGGSVYRRVEIKWNDVAGGYIGTRTNVGTYRMCLGFGDSPKVMVDTDGSWAPYGQAAFQLGNPTNMWSNVMHRGDYINYFTATSGTTDYTRGYNRWNGAAEYEIGTEAAGTGFAASVRLKPASGAVYVQGTLFMENIANSIRWNSTSSSPRIYADEATWGPLSLTSANGVAVYNNLRLANCHLISNEDMNVGPTANNRTLTLRASGTGSVVVSYPLSVNAAATFSSVVDTPEIRGTAGTTNNGVLFRRTSTDETKRVATFVNNDKGPIGFIGGKSTDTIGGGFSYTTHAKFGNFAVGGDGGTTVCNIDTISGGNAWVRNTAGVLNLSSVGNTILYTDGAAALTLTGSGSSRRADFAGSVATPVGISLTGAGYIENTINGTSGLRLSRSETVVFQTGLSGTQIYAPNDNNGLTVLSEGGSTPTIWLLPSGRIGVNAVPAFSNDCGLFVQPRGTSVPSIIAQAVASQTADLQQWRNSSGTNLAKMDVSGNLTAATVRSVAIYPLAYDGAPTGCNISASGGTSGVMVLSCGGTQQISLSNTRLTVPSDWMIDFTNGNWNQTIEARIIRSSPNVIDIRADAGVRIRSFDGTAAGSLQAGAATFSGLVTFTGQSLVKLIRTTEVTGSPTGTTQTLDLGNGNHQTLSLSGASGNVTVTLTVPTSSAAGTIVITQGTTVRNLTWATSAGTIQWMGGQPTWSADPADSSRIVAWRWDGSVMRLAATEVNL